MAQVKLSMALWSCPGDDLSAKRLPAAAVLPPQRLVTLPIRVSFLCLLICQHKETKVTRRQV